MARLDLLQEGQGLQVLLLEEQVQARKNLRRTFR